MIVNLVCAAAACVVMLALMPRFLRMLKSRKMGQTIYDLGPQAHLSKQGTPNMGGVLIGGITAAVGLIAAIVLAISKETIVFFSAENPIFFLLVSAIGAMLIGFADDYTKDIRHQHEGLNPKQKLVGQFALGLILSLWRYFAYGASIRLPFTDAAWNLGVFYVPVMTVVWVFIVNSTHLQDGVDGILSSVTAVGALCFGLIFTFGKEALRSPVQAAFAFALLGACVGFLRFNFHPAKIFMGDTGSMFIGGSLMGMAMASGLEIWLIFIAFTSIMSSVSVILQRGYFKLTHGKRLFKMTPIHHTFELIGMSEEKIVGMYALVTIALCVCAFLLAV
ncbi:MAG: phospho-N-acetylmuramoyl-pentapeptide-transferase [Clostridia bacterium]|nr:phospho-N-acetylmuramoyl-pentapeptide-transferase [Clostridia bacterium]